jgi:hypothetical protein
VAVELRLTRNAAGNRLDLAATLTKRLPATLAALDRGEIDLTRARVIADLTDALCEEHAGQVEDRVLPRAPEQNASQLRQSVRRAVLRIDPHGGAQRHRKRRADRAVHTYPCEDGMSNLSIFAPAEEVAEDHAHIDALARHLRGTGDQRTLDQLRADIALDLLRGRAAAGPTTTAGPAGPAGPAVQVTVGLTTLLGLDELPGDLAGYGPIPAHLARQIAADPNSTWRRLLTDARSGTLLDYGRTTYRPPAAWPTMSAPAMSPASSPAAGGPPADATSTIARPTSTAPPPTTTSVPNADTITGPKPTTAGNSTNSHWAGSCGPHPPAGNTSENPNHSPNPTRKTPTPATPATTRRPTSGLSVKGTLTSPRT